MLRPPTGDILNCQESLAHSLLTAEGVNERGEGAEIGEQLRASAAGEDGDGF